MGKDKKKKGKGAEKAQERFQCNFISRLVKPILFYIHSGGNSNQK